MKLRYLFSAAAACGLIAGAAYAQSSGSGSDMSGAPATANSPSATTSGSNAGADMNSSAAPSGTAGAAAQTGTGAETGTGANTSAVTGTSPSTGGAASGGPSPGSRRGWSNPVPTRTSPPATWASCGSAAPP